MKLIFNNTGYKLAKYLIIIFFFTDQITKKYIGFFIPEGGDALAMALAFYDYVKKHGLEKILLAMSLDGENKNTGTNYYIIISSIYYSTCEIFEIYHNVTL